MSVIGSERELSSDDAWAMPLAHIQRVPASSWLEALGAVAAAIALKKGVASPVESEVSDGALNFAELLLTGERKAILLGNAAAHHAHASSLLALANWIALQTGASVGYLTEAANTVGAQLVHAQPGAGGLNTAQMLDGSGALKALFLLNNEPEFDSFAGSEAGARINPVQMVVTMSPFKANLRMSDVLLPIAPFTETPGTFVNAEGRVQSFHAVVKPLGEARPAWKILRVLANLFKLPGFDFESSQDVLAKVAGLVDGRVSASLLSNVSQAAMTPAAGAGVAGVPVVASIYQLDGVVRRATSLQLTRDARLASSQAEEVAA